MSTVRRPPPLLFQREVDPQPIWPVMLAIGILTVSAAAMIVSTLGFDDARPYQNAVFWLWLLVASASGFVALSIGTRNQLTRRMQTAIVVSVMIHMILAMVLNEQAITVLVTDRPAVSKQVKPLPTIPDYFVPLPNASNENAFERPVETETVHLRTESRERQQEVPKAETPQKQRAEMEALQAVTSPAELQRNDQPTPRRAELLSKLSRQDLTQARISPQPIRAPSESLGQQSKQRIDAPAANAARRQPQQPRLTRRRREPSDSDAQAAVGAPQFAKASPNPPIANRETARLSTPRQVAPGGLAATRARDIAPAVDPAPASENMSSRLAATNTPRLSRNTSTRQPSQTRSRRRTVSSMANASEVASTAVLSSRATPTRRSVTTVNQNASPESLATNRSSAALAQTRATAPAAASDDAQVAATHGESHLQPETGGNRMARRSPMGPAARRGRRGSGAGESTDSLESLAATSESGIQRALGPSRPSEIGRGAPTGSLGSLGVTPQRSSVAEISDEDSGAGDLPTDTNVGQSRLASSEGAANLPGPPAGGLFSNYEFPGDDIPIIKGSALSAGEDSSNDDNNKCIDELMDALDATIPEPERALDKDFLMPIEDVFSITGRGTVVTGRIEQGIVHTGDECEIVGIKDTSKTVITGVEMFRKILDEGQAGDNVGCLLRGTGKDEVERGQVLAKPGSITPHTKFKAQAYILTKDEGGRHTPFFNGYRPQFYFRTTDVTGVANLPDGTEMVMPGDNVEMTVELITPIAMDKELRFAIREGGRTVGAGVVADIIE